MVQKKSTQVKKQPKKLQRLSGPKKISSQKKTDDAHSGISRLNQLRKSFMSRRAHRSFRRTKRRDYVRTLDLPGYIAFTLYVFRTLKQDKKLYLTMLVVFTIVSAVMGGFASQATFTDFTDSLNVAGQDVLTGSFGEIGKAGLLVFAGISGSFSPEIGETQRLYAGLIFLLIWLTTVWLLRTQLAGNKPRLRDGLYNSGSPIVATFLVLMLLFIQLVPAAIAAIVYSSALSTGILSNALYSIVAFFVAIMLIVLSLYLITSTFFALIVSTLPGMYPWRALRIAGDLVAGRRLRILYRLLWCFLVVAIGLIIIMLPTVYGSYLIHQHLPVLDFLPIVPVMLVLVSTSTVIFLSSYIYLLYRKVVDDESAPA